MQQAPPTALPGKEFIILMAIMMSVVAISIDAMLPALGMAGADLNVSNPNHAQLIISCIFAGMGFGQLVAGPLSDSLGRRKVVFGGLFIYFIGSIVCLMAPSIEIMLAGRLVQGLGVAGPFVCVTSIIRDKFSGDRMAKIMSLVMMIFIMVPTIAPALGQGIIMMTDSWRYIFVMYLVYAVAVGIWVYIRLEETLHPEYRQPFNLKAIFGAAKSVLVNKITMSYTVAMGLVFGAMIGYLNSIQQVFQVQFGVGNLFVLLFGLQAMAFGVSSLINSRFVEKYGMRFICLRAVGLLACASLILLILNAVITLPFWAYFLFGATLLFSIAMVFGNINALALEPMGHIAGSASAIIGFVSNLIGIPLGTLIGQAYNGTLTPILTGFLSAGICAFLIIFFEIRGREKMLTLAAQDGE